MRTIVRRGAIRYIGYPEGGFLEKPLDALARIRDERRFAEALEFTWSSFGGRGRNRTYNLSVKSRMLCQLSYASR